MKPDYLVHNLLPLFVQKFLK